MSGCKPEFVRDILCISFLVKIGMAKINRGINEVA
jgi:hypothetical protein